MKTGNIKSKQSHYELLLRAYDKAQAAFERAKTNEKTAKHYQKTADKDISKTDKAILELEYKRAKYRRKGRKTAFQIAKLRLKQWLKLHEEDIKLYQLNEEAQPSENKEADEEKGKMTRSTSDEADTAAAAEKIESKPKKEFKKEPKKKADSLNSNNLIIIEGIGQKVNQYLETAGITSFSQLAASNFETLKGILVANRLQFLDPTSWPQQAQLVVEGKMDDLKTLQEQLKSGRKK
jgi:predicted flap endonuclease-1-like 5' DNA nuclease